jgi:hypothetical protein
MIESVQSFLGNRARIVTKKKKKLWQAPPDGHTTISNPELPYSSFILRGGNPIQAGYQKSGKKGGGSARIGPESNKKLSRHGNPGPQHRWHSDSAMIYTRASIVWPLPSSVLLLTLAIESPAAHTPTPPRCHVTALRAIAVHSLLTSTARSWGSPRQDSSHVDAMAAIHAWEGTRRALASQLFRCFVAEW